VVALETQVRDLDARLTASAQDAAAARVLAGAADRDVSEFRGELREFRGELRDFRQAVASSFNALREDMNDRSARVEEQFTRVDDGFTGIRGKLDATAAGQEHITNLLQQLIDKPDQ
jgi:methyl-accepting chemotaxis protein